MRYFNRRPIAIILILTIMLLLAPEAFCDDPLKKLGRGISNVITSPLEVTYQMQKINNRDGALAGLTVGPVKGLFMTAVRGAVGTYEIATFLFPFPAHYGPILKDPEFFFEELTS